MSGNDGSTRAGATVLIVDDEAVNRDLLAEIVRREGYFPIALASGAEALDHIEHDRPDIVLLDLMMPQMSGLDVLDELARRELTPQLPVVIVSASTEREARLQALARGASDFLSKPIDRPELRARLRNLVALKQARDVLEERGHTLQALVEEQARHLLHAQKMEAVGNIASGIAQDFNNLLTAIVAFTEFVRSDLPEGDSRRDDLAEVLRAAQRGADMTQQLLTFSRRRRPVRKVVDLNDSVLEACRLIERTIGGDFRVSFTPSARPVTVSIDPQQFDQVLVNLSLNARDAMPQGGHIHVRVLQPSKADSPLGLVARVEVADTGAGMAAEVLQRAFEPFFTTKPSGKGTGLGLAVCQTIVEEVGGLIGIESRPGAGTTARIDLPLVDAPVEVDEEPAPESLRGNDELVLVAEDEPALRAAAARVLGEAGYRVLLAADGRAAIDLITQHADELALVFTDVVMPAHGGHVVVDHARRTAPDAAVILTSGYVVETAEPGRSLIEERPVLWKPYTPRMLLRSVSRALSAQRKRPLDSESVETYLLVPEGRGSELGAESTAAEAPGDALVISGDDELVAIFRAVCLDAGFDSSAARDSADAQSLLASSSFAVVAVDAETETEVGPLLRAVRDQQPAAGVLLCAANATTKLVREITRLGAVEYVGKPFTEDEIRAAVDQCMKASRVAYLQSKLLAARSGADAMLRDIETTEASFEQALETLRVAYQPIVRSRDGSIYGFEALLRCDVPGLSNPLAVLAAAEVLGRVVDVGKAVRKRVRQDLDALADRSVCLFVNLHPHEFRAKYLLAGDEPLVDCASRIVFEVTERASLSAGPRLLEEVRRLRGAAYRIAVDDLGEGYAGLSSLTRLVPDVVKIDRSLVQNIDQSPLKEDIVASIVLMARKAGITTVAEGVETEEERDVLTMLGCDLLQGYYFARPGPPFPAVSTSE